MMARSCFTSLLCFGACVLLAGCGTGPAETGVAKGPQAESGQSDSDEHDHGTAGPHGGDVIVLGEEEYHAELTHDEGSHTVTVYLLDSAVKQAVAADQEEIILQVFEDGDFVDYTLAAADGDGTFALEDEQLCDLLLHAEEVRGRVRATIAGKEYVGILDHASHDHAGHEEEGDDHIEDGHAH